MVAEVAPLEGGGFTPGAGHVIEHLGSTSYVYANTKAGEQLIIEREEQRSELGGGRLTVSIPPRRAYVFDAAGKRLRLRTDQEEGS